LNVSGKALLFELNDDCKWSAAFVISVKVSNMTALIIPALPINRGAQTGGVAGLAKALHPSPGSTEMSAGLNVMRFEGLHPAAKPSKPISVTINIVGLIKSKRSIAV